MSLTRKGRPAGFFRHIGVTRCAIRMLDESAAGWSVLCITKYTTHTSITRFTSRNGANGEGSDENRTGQVLPVTYFSQWGLTSSSEVKVHLDVNAHSHGLSFTHSWGESP